MARSSTLRLVDTFAEHDVLEAMLEASKPPVPPECQRLDYRLWSPFRYGSYPGNSRFRRRGRTPGVWYGSEQLLTAICETVWGKLAFFAAAPDTPLPRAAVDYTAVQALAQTPAALDLTTPALAAMGNWTDPDDYAPCLALADAARVLKTGRTEREARISFATPELLWQVLTAKRWELLKALCGAGPVSIHEAARRVDRDVKAVHGDVTALLEAGVLSRADDGRIVFPYDAVKVEFLLRAA